MDNVRLKNCSGGPSPTTIGHSPISKDALDRSVTRLITQKGEVPDYEAGYNDWRQHCGGVYTITLAEIIKADEMAFNSGATCSAK